MIVYEEDIKNQCGDIELTVTLDKEGILLHDGDKHFHISNEHYAIIEGMVMKYKTMQEIANAQR